MDAGVIIISWIILGIVVGSVASSMGRSFLGYMFLSLLLSPLIAFIILAIKGKATPDEILGETAHIFYCPGCKKTFSAIDNSNSLCPNCKTLTMETSVVIDKWRSLTDSEKTEMKKSFEQGHNLRYVQSAPTIYNSPSNADEIKKYKELLDNGAITQEEYEAKKKQLLNL